MAASSTSSWLHTSLLSPSAQQQTAQHGLYGSELPMHSSSHLPHQQQQHVDLGHGGQPPCGAFCQPDNCPLNLDYHQSADSHQLHDFSRPAGGSSSGHAGTGGDSGGHLSARKVHKADREKLRRDRLNEQFADLAGVLDPDRPKNDKATILGDSVQVVRELRSEVKRLRAEQTCLVDESRDLAQEKTELREEKATLKSETEHLQGQIQQRLRLMLPWMAMDPSMMMAAPPYGYPVPVPQQVSAPPASDLNQPVPQVPMQPSVAAPPTYIPLAPTAPGGFALHPALQGYPMYANRPGDGGAPYLQYPHYPSQPTSHPHVERPYPQYPSPMQPLPGYLMQMQPHQGQAPMSGAPPVPSMYQSYVPGMAPMPLRPQGTPINIQARGVHVHPSAPSGAYCAPGQVDLDHSGSLSSVQTTLQLQPPLHPQPQRPSQVGPLDSTDGSSNAQTSVTGSPASGIQREGQSAAHNEPMSNLSNSTNFSHDTTSIGGLSSPGASSTTGRQEVMASQGSRDGEGPQRNDLFETRDSTLRPPTT